MGIFRRIHDLTHRIRRIEERDTEAEAKSKRYVHEMMSSFMTNIQSQRQYGLFLALCVDTIDPLKLNRVRYFSPLHHSSNAQIRNLPFANPISSFGGFDDCGSSWVPPAGSTLCMTFENGHPKAGYYHGTTWHRDRGPDTGEKGGHNWNFNLDEYYKIHEGHRLGYLVGPNDGSQVFAPWNNESYNGFDPDSSDDFDPDPEAQKRIAFPNIYGFKTPQKHMLKLVDGDYNCNHRWKRLVLQSGGGSGYMIFKDDHMHPAGQWAHPDCEGGGSSSSNIENCLDEDGNPIEKPEDCGLEFGPGDSPARGWDDTFANPFFKHKNECWPYAGPGTPQNNRVELEQGGIQLLSGSGHTFIFDDSVEEPQGIPNWERSLEPFDFGCTDIFKGSTSWISATGHKIEMSDVESDTNIRGEENYIRILSAAGNRIELNDHSIGSSSAGNLRGITLESTSKHSIQMMDEENEQELQPRQDGGIPVSKATKAFVKIRSGYGIQIEMNDDASQEETQQQFFQITSPQTDNTDRGPHVLRMQEKADGPGQVFLRCGGDYICSVNDDHYTIVGDREKNPTNKITIVSKHTVDQSQGFHFSEADTHAMLAKEVILLMAGDDQQSDEGCSPFIWPVLCWSPKGITISDKVFVTATDSAQTASLFGLEPFIDNPDFENVCSSPGGLLSGAEGAAAAAAANAGI